MSANGGRAAAGLVEALKGSPLVLALIITNFALLFYLFYAHSKDLDQRKHIADMVMQHCIKKP